MRKLKVYGWTGNRHACPRAPNGGQQTREIVAAHSWAEASRIHGKRVPRQWGSVTGNVAEIAWATSKPGKVFWRPLDEREGAWVAARPGVPY